MTLTREQALVAAGVLALAFEAAAAAPPGGTIAQGAAATAAAATAAGPTKSGHGAPKKVATAPGSAKYHAPIGALIIPHTHFVKGQPSHMIHSTSEPEWIANQWKKEGGAPGAAAEKAEDAEQAAKDKTEEAQYSKEHAAGLAEKAQDAEQAVAAGTHHWVQAGEHTYAVHNGLGVHVPKDTDIHDEAAVKKAPKVVVKHGPEPEHVSLKAEGSGEVQPHDAGSEHLLKTGYKKLPDQPVKKAVTFEGKHAAWVPHDWQVYKSAGAADAGLHSKYAKDPEGHWHQVGKNGQVSEVPEYNVPSMENWAKSGEFVPDSHPGPEPGHVAPNQAAEGTEKPKVDIGGVAVSKEEIHDALAKLQGSTSTQIKGLLKGHPLAESDYHAVFKAELEAHPELKVPSGTKKQHASPAKLAFIHHLAGQADKLAQDEAQAQAAKLAKDKAEAAAQHAQQLTPGTYDVGGVSASAEDIQAAVAALTATKSTSIKQILKAKGNLLAASDYWKVIHDYQAGHPAELQHGTKQAHAPNAKTAFIAALNELASQAATGDLQSGHDEAAQIDQALSGGTVKPGWHESANGAVAMALVSAASHGSPRYASLSPEPGVWWISPKPPEGKAYYEVTPEHKVALHLSSGHAYEWTQQHVTDVVQGWVKAPAPKVGKPTDYEDFGAWKAAKDAEDAAAELEKAKAQAEALKAADEAAKLKPEPQPAWDTKAWKQTPEYQAVHDLIQNHPPGLPEHGNKFDLDQQLVAAVYVAGKLGSARYLASGTDGGWKLESKVPAGIAGTFGIPGKAYYEISPDHEITAYANDGQPVAVDGGTIKQIAEKWLTQPEPAAGTVPVTMNGKVVYHAPAGTTLWYDLTDEATKSLQQYLRAADGTWQILFEGDTKPTGSANSDEALDAAVVSGAFEPISEAAKELAAKLKAGEPEAQTGPKFPPVTVQPEPEPEPAKPELSSDVQHLKQLLINGAVKPSAQVEDGKQNPDWVLVAALQKAAKTGAEKWATKKDSGVWITTAYLYSAGAEYFHVTADLAVTHHADGTDTALSPEKVSELAHQLTEPDSVKIDVGGKYAITYQIFKHGFYYKPSKQAKAYLEIKPPGDGYTATTFTYHAPSGDKQVNASYAAKVLQDATEYHAQAKDTLVLAAKKVSYATAAKPGGYQAWSDIEHGVAADYSVDVLPDGSLLLGKPGGQLPLPAVNDQGDAPIDALIKGGTLLDQYGTSVVKPGVAVDTYHIFGSAAKTPEELQSALNMLEQHYGDKLDITEILTDFLPGVAVSGAVHEAAMSFWSAKLASGTWQGQRDSFIGLLRELLQVPAQPPGTDLGTETGSAAAVTFLKGLPPGIHGAKDVFTWTDKGYAKPVGIQVSLHYSSPEISASIKEVSAQFGDGKVVGTHISSLSKDQKLAWLKAWQAGDMAKVFALDAAGGKVSPVHPGAPDNAATHHITWAPWDESQVPAGQVVEGTWSALDVQPSKAEADNYLIKAGLQHAAFLTLAERRAWISLHRQHDQQAVDKLSKTAADRFNTGSQALSEPPVWTDHVEPAKSYTIFLEDNTAAQNWTYQARTDYVAEHKAELLPFAQQIIQEKGLDYTPEDYLSSEYYSNQVIQRYLDDKAAKELAEKLRPKYELVPGEPGQARDQHGHQYLWHPGGGKAAKQRLAVWQLAKAWGLKTPKVQQVKLEDGSVTGTITDMVAPDAGTLALLPAGIAGLTGRELADLAREHVFDYALGNPSSTPGSYVRSGGSIIGTGKDGAFSDLAWNGADLQQMNAVTVQPVSKLFDAIASGQLSQDQADTAYIAAVRSARRMSQLSGSRLAAILNDAGLSLDDQTEMFGRVTGLPDAIQGLWDKAYAQHGWTPPEVPVAKLPHGLHAGFSEPEFFDHVMAAKASGVPAFFAGPHLEDGNFLVWTEKAGDNRYVRGESALRGDALASALKWAKANVTGGEKPPEPVPEPEAGVKNTASWYAKIIGAAKAVSFHAADQMWEGNWTKQKLEALASLKTELTSLVIESETAAHSSDPTFASFHGPPDLVKQAAKYYLEKVAQVEDHKANALSFSPGDIPDWEPPPKPEPAAEPPKPEPPAGIKVEYLKATRVLSKAQLSQNIAPSGDIVDGQGELQLGSAIYEYPGYAYHITLPTGEVIELNDEGQTSSPLSHHGRVRFRAVASDGSASLERIHAQLQDMGVPLEEASPEDMELFYWRHLTGILADRKDRQEGKHAQVWASLGSDVPAVATVSDEGEKAVKVIAANLDPAAELEVWHKAWANLTSAQQVQDWADKGGYYPHLKHLNTAAPDVPSGKPDWYRFDADPAWLAQRQLVGHALSSSESAPYHIATTGGLYSTEGRLRALGAWISGASSSADMEQHGSSGFVYTRLNQESEYSNHVLMSPRVLARTSTYGFKSDSYGDVKSRKVSAYFDLAQAAAHTGNSNETEIKDVVSLLDDIMLLNARHNRQKVIDALKARGITEIRGLPVEDRIVDGITSAAIAKVKAAEPAPETWFEHPSEAWSPPQAEAVTKAQSVVESEAEKSASAAATPGDALKNALYSTDHSAAATPEAVSQVVYHAPSQPANALSGAPALKHDVASRVAGKMTSSDEQVQALADAAGLAAPEHWGESSRVRTAAALVASWSQSNSSPIALALQNAARKLFGISKDPLAALGYADASTEVAAQALEEGYGQVLEDFLAAQWAETQAELASGNVEQLTLYRVFHFSDVPEWAKSISAGDVVDAPQARPLSSWAFLQAAAESAGTFAAGGKTVVVKAMVPASAALSFPRTGFGAYSEAEFVILDMNGQWEIIKVEG